MKKPRRPPTKIPRPKAKGRLPSDIADAAEAALDDMIAALPEPDDDGSEDVDLDDVDDEPKTQTRAPSHDDVVLDDDDEEELLSGARRHDSEVLARVTKTFAPREDSVESPTQARGYNSKGFSPSDDERPTRARPAAAGDEPKTRARPAGSDEPPTRARPGDDKRGTLDVATLEQTTASAGERRTKMPLPAPARTTSAHTVGTPSAQLARGSAAPGAARTESSSTPTPKPSLSFPPTATQESTRPSQPPSAPPLRTSTPGPSLATPPPLRAPIPSPPPRAQAPSTPPPTRQVPLPKLELAAPITRAEHTTSERNSSLDQTSPLSDDDKLDAVLDSGPDDDVDDGLEAALEGMTADPEIYTAPIDADQLINEQLIHDRPAIEALQVAVYEESALLGSAQSAIAAAGHSVEIAAAGRDGPKRVIEQIHAGEIDAVIVALPGGEAIIDAALALDPRRPVVIASLHGSSVDAIDRAHAAGADLVITRPYDVDKLAPILLAASRLYAAHHVALAARGSEQVLRARLDEISDPEPRGLIPFEMFQRVLELEIKRAKRFEYPLSVALFAVEVDPPPPPPGIRGILRARAGNVLIHTVRDIDMATQLDHERFLVLLPYTDLKGAANVGRRVIAAVRAGDPVVAVGRSFPPRLVGAVAGGSPSKELSFAKLMKDATRALEQARRDGAELAVQP